MKTCRLQGTDRQRDIEKIYNETCYIKTIISALVEKQLHVSFYSVFFVITTLIPSFEI